MAQKLTKIKSDHYKQKPIANVKKQFFKISIEMCLDNNFSFKDLNKEALKSFDKFVKLTVGKKLTISDVDNEYRRTRGPKDTITVDGIDYERIHFGKDRNPFRIFGYYNSGYFVLTRIDPKHKTHK